MQQVNTFLSRIFGDGPLEGHITLGFIPVDMSTGSRGKMQPAAFEWPREKKRVLRWVEEKSRRGEVYYCPALRKDGGRKKGNAVPGGLQWLWADVDMEKVPEHRKAAVLRAISLLATLTVRSGTGDNCHVYVNLSEAVSAEEHEYLNTLLRDLLSADNKQADNSLLRIAGTWNYKGVASAKKGESGKRGVECLENRKGGGRRGKALGADVVTRWLEKHWGKLNGESKGGERETLGELRARLAAGGGYENRGKEGVDWQRVSGDVVKRLMVGGLKSLVTMSTDRVDAGEYGGRRYQAVRTVAERVYRNPRVNGDRNIVHTLMSDFPPGVSKEREERSYNLHRDLERVLDAMEAGLKVEEVWGDGKDGSSYAVSNADDEGSDEKGRNRKRRGRDGRDLGADESGVSRKRGGDAEEVDRDSDEEEEGDVSAEEDPWNPDPEWVDKREARTYWGIKTSESARRRLRAEEAALTLPSLDAVIDEETGEVLQEATFETFDEMETRGIPEQQYFVDGLCGVGHTVTITAQYKTGKTTFALNLARALVQDNEEGRGDFLGSVKLMKRGREAGTDGARPGEIGQGWNVVVWNCEMDRSNLGRDVMKMGLDGEKDPDTGESEKSRLGIWSLRGSRVDIMSEDGFKRAVESLTRGGKDGGVGSTRVWIIDSFARLCAMSGVDENDNSTVMQLLRQVDAVKRAAGVSECFVLVHTGRGEQESGKERARGATSVDDWADVRWILTKDDMGHRYLRADGRGVSMDETVLTFDKSRLLLGMGAGNRGEVRSDDLQTIVVDAIGEFPGISLRKLKGVVRKAMQSAGGGTGAGVRDAVLYEVLEDAQEAGLIKKRRGERNASCYFPNGGNGQTAQGVRDSRKASGLRSSRPSKGKARSAATSSPSSAGSSRKRRPLTRSRSVARGSDHAEEYLQHLINRPHDPVKPATVRLLDMREE